jgi:hypothetical protein
VSVPFAHASEAEMSRILDFYAVRWEYEPHTFPILWNLDGDVVESFSPDFYLPDLDLYLEMTTLRQKLVRRKNRKLRRLRELYPDLNVKLFYARDFRALMLKYGKLALAAGLSGTLGQVAAPYDTPDDVIDVVDVSAAVAAALPEGGAPVADRGAARRHRRVAPDPTRKGDAAPA